MSWSDLHVDLVGFSGNTVTVQAFNPQNHAETARVRVGVALAGGNQPTLTSANFTLQAGESRNVQLAATGSIASITDGPVPIEPS